MPSDLINVLPVGMLPYPGVCRYCGSNQRPCVDFGINTEYDGAILICTDCFIVEIVKVEELGLITRDSVSKITDGNAELMLKLAATELLKEKLRDDVVGALDSFDSAVADSTRDYVPIPEDSDAGTAKLF